MKLFYEWGEHPLKRIGEAKVYLVGGFVRDTLLGLNPQDADYVVVGATPQQMLDYGFSQVGADFPVFLHPRTSDEYALARTERKIGSGYLGFETNFSPDITIEDDLHRRDLTINSMAIDLDTEMLIDPYGGYEDLLSGIFRHTSEAFKDDPVRVLRLARFAARYDFAVHKQTRDFILQMVKDGVIDELNPERVWAEFERGLMERNPRRMFEVLDQCEALRKLSAPWYGGLYASGIWDFTTKINHLSVHQRFGLIAEHFTEQDLQNARIPSEAARLASLLQRWKNQIPNYLSLEPVTKLELLASIGAIGKYRKTDLLDQFEKMYSAWADTRFDKNKPTLMTRSWMTIHSIEINKLVPPSHCKGQQIAEWMQAARLAIVSKC